MWRIGLLKVDFLWVYVDIFAVSAVVVGFVLIFGLICGGGCCGF